MIDRQLKSDIATLFQSGAIITGINPNLDIVNMNAHTKFGEIVFFCSPDVE